jgi:hypothetical protein
MRPTDPELIEERIPAMLEMLRDLVRHKGYANASMLRAIRQHETAAQDVELRGALHHILLANRFWLYLILDLPFDIEAESKIPESLDAIEDAYRNTYSQEVEWISRIGEAELGRSVVTTLSPGQHYSVAQGMMQVCMHTQGHRAPVCDQASTSGRHTSTDGLYYLVEGPTGARLAVLTFPREYTSTQSCDAHQTRMLDALN